MDEKLSIRLDKVDFDNIYAQNNTGMNNPVAKNKETDDKTEESVFAAEEDKKEEETFSVDIPKTPEELNNIAKEAKKYSIKSEKLKEFDIDINKPLVITDELKSKFKAKGKKGFWECLKEGKGNAIPFASGVIDIAKSAKLLNIIRKQKKGEILTKDETEKLYEYILKQTEEAERGTTFGGKVAQMLTHLPAFAGEFLLTGGIYSLGKTAAQKTITKGLQTVTRKQLMKYITKNVVETMAGSAARTIALSHMGVGNYYQRRINIEMNDKEESKLKTALKAGTDSYIEVLSEQAGESLQFAGGLIGNKFLKTTAGKSAQPLITKALSSKPMQILTSDGAKRFAAKTGFNGIFGEYFEERLGGALKAVAQVSDEDKSTFQNLKEAILPGWEQTGVEFTTSALWGGTLYNGHYYTNKIKMNSFTNNLINNLAIYQKQKEEIQNNTTLSKIAKENKTKKLADEFIEQNIEKNSKLTKIWEWLTTDDEESAKEVKKAESYQIIYKTLNELQKEGKITEKDLKFKLKLKELQLKLDRQMYIGYLDDDIKNKENIFNAAKIIFQNKDISPFSLGDITNILKEAGIEDKAFAEYLYKNKNFDEQNTSTYKEFIIMDMLFCIDAYIDDPNFANWILTSKETENFRTENSKYVGDIILAHQYNLNFADWLLKSKETKNFRTPENIKYLPDIIRRQKRMPEFVDWICTSKECEKIRKSKNIKYIADITKLVWDKPNLKDKAKEFCNDEKFSAQVISLFINYPYYIIRHYNDYKNLIKRMGIEKVLSLKEDEIIPAINLQAFYKVTNINEIPRSERKEMIKTLVELNIEVYDISKTLKKDFPLIPTNKDEYCELLPQLVRSLGIETKEINQNEISKFNKDMNALSENLEKLSDSDFASLEISQEFSRNDFITTVLEKIKDLSENEKQKVFDYYGFELKENDKTENGYTLIGYPANLHNGEKLAQIENIETKKVIESLRGDVIRFSENNRIKSNHSEIEILLNEMAKALPEIHTLIGNMQHDTQDFDIMKHSLKVMQKIIQSEEYKKLSESDKKIMLLASLLHDITKFEAHCDKIHATESSFDGFYIARKFKLSKEEEIKLYTLIKNHEWLEFVNTAVTEKEQIKRMQSVAFDLQQDNLLDMALIFTHADLRAVKINDEFHDKTEGEIRHTIEGTQRSFGESADIYAKKIKEYIQELKKSQPLLPVTKLPSADKIKANVTKINADGSTNIKGLYIDKKGLPIIKFNEIENWEDLGFPKGTISKGIKAKLKNGTANTGNIKFFVHGLDFESQLIKFDAFSLLDSDVLLSVSYAERPESKFRFFRTQGVILDADTKYVYGGGETDSGSGCGKEISDFKDHYIFGGPRESDRLFVSNLIKKVTGMNDNEYLEFVERNKNKSFSEIEPAELREILIKAFATINSNTRNGEREYNEMYLSNPRAMGVFAYAQEGKINNPVEYSDNHEKIAFLKKFALERNLPMIIFGE